MVRSQVIDAEGHTPQDNGMVSIPRSDRGLDINYRSNPGSRGSRDYDAGSGTPTSPSTWEETLQSLSRELKVICRSPDKYETPCFPPPPQSPDQTSGPASPTASEQSRNDARLLQVRHLQSEERLREKLSVICRSPRRPLQSASSCEERCSPPAHPIVRPIPRKACVLPHTFRTTIDIGNQGIEDLHVYIEDHKLKVQSVNSQGGSEKDTNSTGSSSSNSSDLGDLPVIIQLPPDVNPEKLICVIKNGILEVREGKRRGGPTRTGRHLHGLDLRRSLSSSCMQRQRQRHHSGFDQSPIVIEADGSPQLKLVLKVPDGFTIDDIKIKTVDDHLIVSGLCPRESSTSSSTLDESLFQASSSPTSSTPPLPSPPTRIPGRGKRSPSSPSTLITADLVGLAAANRKELFQVFELPDSVDPYSITAHLTDSHKLIIHASLSSRNRCNSI